MDSLSIQRISETCTLFTQPTLNVGEYDNTLIDTSTAPTCFVFAVNPAHRYITGKSFNIVSWAIGTVYYFHRTDNLKNHFNELVSEWHEQRGFASSISDIIGCAAYQEIIKLSYKALPLIFERLQAEKDDPDFWFVALAEITGANPVKSENRGNMKKMAQDWLLWNQNDQCIREMLYRFPKIDALHLKITSPQTYAYNCVGWAANDDNRVWWPHSSVYWPDTAPLTETVDAFVKAFQSIGFIDCDSGDLDSGFEKIVIYANDSGAPKHVARQLPNGKWTSKIGHFEDIEHGTPDCLSSDAYGSPVRFMKRPIQKG